MKNLNDITILVTLFDRSYFTKIWLKENYYESINYFIADGSKNEDNSKIFKNFKKKNLTYKRFPYDKTLDHYFSKVITSLELIESKYVMISDNDDFINLKGIEKIINFLLINKSFDLAGGDTRFVDKDKTSINRYYLTNQKFSSAELSNLDKNEVINKYIKDNSTYLWYCVYQKSILLKVFKIMKNLKIYDWQFLELSHTIITLALSNYSYVKCTHYIRLRGDQSLTSQYNKKDKVNIFNKIQNDKETKKHLNNLVIFLQNTFEFDKKSFYISIEKKAKVKNIKLNKNNFIIKLFFKLMNKKSLNINLIRFILNIMNFRKL